MPAIEHESSLAESGVVVCYQRARSNGGVTAVGVRGTQSYGSGPSQREARITADDTIKCRHDPRGHIPIACSS